MRSLILKLLGLTEDDIPPVKKSAEVKDDSNLSEQAVPPLLPHMRSLMDNQIAAAQKVNTLQQELFARLYEVQTQPRVKNVISTQVVQEQEVKKQEQNQQATEDLMTKMTRTTRKLVLED